MAESIAAPWQKAPWLKDPWQQLLDAQARYAHAIAIEAGRRDDELTWYWT